MTGREAARSAGTLARRTAVRLTPDPRRVITKLFVPGDEVPEHSSRAAAVISRVMDLDEAEVSAVLAETLRGFSGRHRDLAETLDRHFASIAHRLDLAAKPSAERRRLIGAYFTHEYSVEAAALFNPSIVAHPDQSGLDPGQVRFVLSVRAVGEGHLSSIGFRTGVAGPRAAIRIDEAGRLLSTGTHRPALHDLRLILEKLGESGDGTEVTAYLARHLGASFTTAQLRVVLAELDPQLAGRLASQRAIERIHQIAAGSYEVEYGSDTALDERVLWPASPAESHGMEDARFVSFTEDDGTAAYYATYTAYDGSQVAPQMLRTIDFRRFHVFQLTGAAAANKGMALFPRRIGGRYFALSRYDRECTSITASRDMRHWEQPRPVQSPRNSWELTQIGNCGSPIETADGWLVLTHGVGPMRSYAIGAILLDLADPGRILGRLAEPLLVAGPDERDGYVPNVVYSCGSMLHDGRVILPFGHSDSAIGIAHVDLGELLAAMD